MSRSGRIGRRAAPVAIAVVLAGTAAGAVLWRGPLARSAGTWFEVQPAPFVETVEATGELESERSARIGVPNVDCTWNFTIIWLAPEGEEVGEGDPLVRFDTRELDQKLALSRSAVEAAGKELEQARLDAEERIAAQRIEVERLEMELAKAEQKAAIPEGVAASSEVEAARLDLEQARHALAAGRAKLDSITADTEARIGEVEGRLERLRREADRYALCIERMTVTAPRPGLVVYATRWDGEKVKVGEEVWVGRSVMELPDLTAMRVKAKIDEVHAGRVRVGQPARIRLDARPERIFHGQVVEIGDVFRPRRWDKPSVVFDAAIAIDDPDPETMRPGMAARVEIVVDESAAAITVPDAAVVYAGAETFVEVAAGLSTRRVPIALGRRSGERVEVLSGLAPGDRVLVPEREERP